MLKQHKDILALSSEFDVFRDRIDRLIQSDVVIRTWLRMITYLDSELLGSWYKRVLMPLINGSRTN